MADIPCIYDMSLVNEKDNLKEDIIKGKALEILLTLLSGSKTIKEIAKELNIPSFSIQLYVKRLMDNNFIRITEEKVIDGKIEKTYELASTDIQILNYLRKNCKNSDGTENIELSAQHFASLTREIIKNVGKCNDKPHKIKAYFIKSDEETMQRFKEDLDKLFDKYQALEDENSIETYGLITAFAPYKLD